MIDRLIERARGAAAALFGAGAADSPDTAVTAGALPPSQHKVREFFQHHRLADLLPYESYDPDTQVFHNDDGYGFILQCAPATGANDTMIEVLSGLFNQGYPEGTGLQLMMWASPNVMPLLGGWASSRLYDPEPEAAGGRSPRRRNASIYGLLARRRIEALRHGAQRSILRSEPFMLRNFVLLVSVVFPGRADEPGLSRLIKTRDGLAGMFKRADLPCRNTDAGDLLNFLDEVINVNDEPRRTPLDWDEGRLLRDQIVDRGSHLLVGHNGLVLNRHAVRCLSVRGYPKEWPLWGMGDLIGDMFSTSMQIPCPYLFTAGFTIPDQDAVRRDATMKAARATYDADSQMAKWFPEWAEKKADWEHIRRSMDAGHGLVRAYHQIITFSPLSTGAQMEQAVRDLFRSRGWVMQADTYMHVQSLLSALPLTLTREFAKELDKFGRLSTRTTWNAANMLPVIGEWNGTRTPTLLLFGRRGQVQYLDFFDNDQGNFNVAIAASSGAGKSVLLNEVAASYVGCGGRAWIIEAGKSFQPNIQLLGGQYLAFDPDGTPISVNPFTRIRNTKSFEELEVHLLKPLIAQMAAPREGIDDIQNTYIEQALRHAWETEGNDATITTLAAWLENQSDDRARDVGKMLYPYTRRGSYARYFEPPSNLDFDNPLFGLDVGGLESKKDLQSTIVLLALLRIQQAMYGERRDRKKVCIIDEGHRFLGSSGQAAAFIEIGYREARKYTGSFICATQRYNDYFVSPAAQAALDNADWMCFLRQKKESIDHLEKSGRLAMDGYMKRVLTSINTQQGEYSELMVIGPQGFAVGRLMLDEFTSALYSSRGADVERLHVLRAQGMSLTEAIERMVSEKRGGTRT